MTGSLSEHPRGLRQEGFNLIELAIVLAVVSLLAGGLLGAMSGQQTRQREQEARKQLDEARETILGFAIANGRLPCPAAPNIAQGAAQAGREDCSLQHGVLPWSSLGLPEIDPWGRRLTYFASRKFTAMVAPGALAAFTLATGIAPDNSDTANVKESSAAIADIAIDLPAVLVCHGEHGAGAWLPDGSRNDGALGDELENADADLVFVARPPGTGFDDLVTWLPGALLKSRLLAAGRLP
jgi:prepilin-type N-terminal cleavage/methylation domain-containing protein